MDWTIDIAYIRNSSPKFYDITIWVKIICTDMCKLINVYVLGIKKLRFHLLPLNLGPGS